MYVRASDLVNGDVAALLDCANYQFQLLLPKSCSIYIRYLQIAFSPGALAILIILTQSITVASVEVWFVDVESGRDSLFFIRRALWQKKIQRKNRHELILTAE